MRIKNAKIFQPDGTFKETDLVTDGEYIKSDAKADHEIVDGFELFAIPALIDVHVSQCGNVLFDEGGNFAIDQISDLEAQNGVLTWYGVTKLPAAHAEKAARFMDKWNEETKPLHPECADLEGLVLERPIAHIEDAKPSDESWKDLAYDDADEFAQLEDDTKKAFKLIEVDAAKPGADKYITLVHKDACVALTDNDPTFADAEKAFKAGATMAQRYWGKECVLDEKRPTVLQAVLQNDGKFLQLLVGEDNVDKRNVTSTFANFQDKIVLSSADGNLYDAMKRLIELGVPEADAINACTITPALALKVADKLGTLEDGKLANILLVDKNFHIRHVIHRGKMIIYHKAQVPRTHARSRRRYPAGWRLLSLLIKRHKDGSRCVSLKASPRPDCAVVLKGAFNQRFSFHAGTVPIPRDSSARQGRRHALGRAG